MKLSKVLHEAARVLQAVEGSRPSTGSHKAHRAPRATASDGFEATQAAKVDLGKVPAASSAADADFVKGLYRDLLGREPDAAGFESHLRGLQSGMSRDEIRQVFLTSPEYREKSAAGPVAGPGPVESAPQSSTDQLKKLIAADIMTAGGRVATQADYDYWLPKLQSPCDSGFVTSGQMTGVEYYHRRMLGWQAGGSDLAKFGPYAGSPDAHGPVPAATDVVGPLLEG